MEDSGFSGVVRLSNVSDFIAPNLDCIIPLETKAVEKKAEPSLVNIRKKEKNEESKPKDKTSIKISLADCLACNGCITSAETVLIEEQSLSRVWEGVATSQLSVVTVSPQAICSISAKLGIGAEEVAKMVSAYFLSKGVTYVIDSSFARQLSLSLAYEELLSIPSTSRPLLSSACPGFVCYAEKSHGELLVPRISKIRSPQAVTGAIVKNYLRLKHGIEPCHVFHASIMPCFDKKLEASREQLKAEGTEIRETDCVVSTAELFEEIEKLSRNPTSSSESPRTSQNNWLDDLSRGRIIGEYGGSSGGYAERIVRQYLELNGGNLKSSKLNKNMETIEVSDNEGNVGIRVAKVYGFRNIQNLVRKMKTKKAGYDYVEIMACPGGCGNGGGQIRYETSDMREQKLAEVDKTYESLASGKSDREEAELRSVTEEWAKLNPNWKNLLITDYKAVETNISQVLKW